MPLITEPAVYDPINDEWVQVVRDAETGEVIGTNTRKAPFDEEAPE
jgi:hypothetical protein